MKWATAPTVLVQLWQSPGDAGLPQSPASSELPATLHPASREGEGEKDTLPKGSEGEAGCDAGFLKGGSVGLISGGETVQAAAEMELGQVRKESAYGERTEPVGFPLSLLHRQGGNPARGEWWVRGGVSQAPILTRRWWPLQQVWETVHSPFSGIVCPPPSTWWRKQPRSAFRD